MASLFYSPTGSGSTTYSNVYLYSTGTSSTTVSTVYPDNGGNLVWVRNADNAPVRQQDRLYPGQRVKMPDGSTIEVDNQGNYKILDEDAQVTYKGNRLREFNKYINASDLLEDFIKDLGVAGIKQGEVLGVPIEFFINWLIHKAAEQDGDPVPEELSYLPPQLELFAMADEPKDPTPESLRDKGIAQVLRNTDPRFHARYEDCFYIVLAEQEYFIGEDVTLRFKDGLEAFMQSYTPPMEKPPNPHFYGGKFNGLIRRFLKSGRIIEVGVRKTRTLSAHAKRSILYRKVKTTNGEAKE